MVMNVSTVSFVSKYLKTGMPLISRRLTLDGNALKKNAGNYNVLVGTRVSELLAYCEADKPEKVLYGGPMMGICIYDTDQPVIKVNNAILALKDVKEPKTTACIRCGCCVSVCPMNLMPLMLEAAYKKKDVAELNKLKLMLCMNCGCCSYICPANRPLAEVNQLAKGLLMKKK
jgi:electron transport complex protein RnfC